MIAEIDARIKRYANTIRQAFRGVLTLVKAAGNVQLVQVDGLAGEQLQDNELFQHYGYTSNPPPGTMAIVLPIGGKTAHGIIIATEHGNYRLKDLASGEVAIYSDEGDSVILKRGRLIEVTTETLRINTQVMEVNASASIDFNTPMVNTDQALNVTGLTTLTGGMAVSGGGGSTATITGNLVTVGTITNNGKAIDSSHQHSGVLAGAANTGTPV